MWWYVRGHPFWSLDARIFWVSVCILEWWPSCSGDIKKRSHCISKAMDEVHCGDPSLQRGKFTQTSSANKTPVNYTTGKRGWLRFGQCGRTSKWHKRWWSRIWVWCRYCIHFHILSLSLPPPPSLCPSIPLGILKISLFCITSTYGNLSSLTHTWREICFKNYLTLSCQCIKWIFLPSSFSSLIMHL